MNYPRRENIREKKKGAIPLSNYIIVYYKREDNEAKSYQIVRFRKRKTSFLLLLRRLL